MHSKIQGVRVNGHNDVNMLLLSAKHIISSLVKQIHVVFEISLILCFFSQRCMMHSGDRQVGVASSLSGS